jgi:hypothetical protein
MKGTVKTTPLERQPFSKQKLGRLLENMADVSQARYKSEAETWRNCRVLGLGSVYQTGCDLWQGSRWRSLPQSVSTYRQYLFQNCKFGVHQMNTFRLSLVFGM